MKKPALSIIIPYYNSHATLPAMLDSILAQPFQDYEVIVADGHSPEPCQDIVDNYVKKGMAIKAIRAPRRQYVLASRLAGFAESRGKAIFFADTDDLLPANDALEKNVAMSLDNNCDIVNFCTIRRTTQADGTMVDTMAEDTGLGAALEGREIFKKFLRTPTSYPNLWSKIYSRQLLEKIWRLPILNHPDFYGAEDRMLNTVCMFFASSYLASANTGYIYYYPYDKFYDWGLKSIHSYVLMIEEFPPLFRKYKADEEDIELLVKKLKQMLTFYTKAIMTNAPFICSEPVPDSVVEEACKFTEPEQLLKGLIIGNPAWKIR